MCCKEFVAMSLCALIYRKIRRITSVDDMTQIVTVGSQIYSTLSLLARQSMLMLRDQELPERVSVFELIFQLECRKVILVTCMVMPELR